MRGSGLETGADEAGGPLRIRPRQRSRTAARSAAMVPPPGRRSATTSMIPNTAPMTACRISVLRPATFGYLPRNFYDGDASFETFNRRQVAISYILNHRFNKDWSYGGCYLADNTLARSAFGTTILLTAAGFHSEQTNVLVSVGDTGYSTQSATCIRTVSKGGGQRVESAPRFDRQAVDPVHRGHCVPVRVLRRGVRRGHAVFGRVPMVARRPTGVCGYCAMPCLTRRHATICRICRDRCAAGPLLRACGTCSTGSTSRTGCHYGPSRNAQASIKCAGQCARNTHPAGSV